MHALAMPHPEPPTDRSLRKQNEVLLAGMQALGEVDSRESVLLRVTRSLRQPLGFDEAFVVQAAERADVLEATVVTDPGLLGIRWRVGPSCAGCLAGGEVVVHEDARAVAEWAEQPPALRERAGSALLLPLRAAPETALLVCIRRDPDAFGREQVEAARLLQPLAAQALAGAERAGQAARASRELRLVLDSVNQGLVTLDREGRVVGEASAKVAEWFGRLEPRTQWLSVLARVDPAYAEEFRVFFEGVQARREPTAEQLGLAPRRLTVAGRPLSCEVRQVVGEAPWRQLLLLVSDETERRRKEQLETELRHAQKMEAVGQLAAGIAHELNTPTQYVGDSLQFLADSFRDLLALNATYRRALQVLRPVSGLEVEEELRRAEETADLAYVEENAPSAFERAQEGVSRITRIVRAMKEFAYHPESNEHVPADVNRALNATLTIARNEYKYVADVELELGELPPVVCDIGDLNQVFLNLLVNAAHAIGDVVGRTGQRGRIHVRTAHEGERVRIDIRDTGTGIPEAIRDRIFEPFFTTKEVGKGSGQGLSIAWSIVVERHHGTLTFESRVGEGTTFTVLLPVNGKGG